MKQNMFHIDVANRILSWREFGAVDGHPVFYFHSYPSSSLEASFIDGAAAERGLRIIAIDRPGMGDSSLAPIRHIPDIATDTKFLAKYLGIEKFAVLAFSEGAPYAWACGALLADRVTKIAVVSGVVPGAHHWSATAKAMRALATLPFETRRLRNPEKTEQRWIAALSEQGQAEADAAHNAAYRNVMLEARAEAFLEGSGGPAKDYALVTGANWGFALGKVAAPSIAFHGDADLHTPVAEIRQLCTRTHACEVNVFAHEGHHSLWVNHHTDALDAIRAE